MPIAGGDRRSAVMQRMRDLESGDVFAFRLSRLRDEAFAMPFLELAVVFDQRRYSSILLNDARQLPIRRSR